ncbi:MAG: hypothetical protein AB7U05_05055 [Mangrovibacterium sp.]|tara:strand:- start:3655 stop:4023 length:369 start_codon:yes stop_codon:yes gene_type:complete
MKTSNPSNKMQKPKTPHFQDVSRFTRMVSQLDSRDRSLEPKRRRGKWILILCGMFLLFLASFLLPFPDFSHEKIGAGEEFFPADSKEKRQVEQATFPGFEMPVDSFENLLKKHIHEDIPETK